MQNRVNLILALAMLLSACGQSDDQDDSTFESIDDALVDKQIDFDGRSPVDSQGFPLKEPKKGNHSVACNSPDAGKCRNMVEKVADFYRRNSRGMLNLSYTPAANGDYKFNVDPTKHHNNAGVLTSFQVDVAEHEMGHKLGLGHAVRMPKKSDGNYFRDFTTVMNPVAVGAPFLNAPEYYEKGWIPAEEVALYDPAVNTYELKRITDFQGKGLSTVIVMPSVWNAKDPTRGVPVFISFPSPGRCPDSSPEQCFTLHFLTKNATLMIDTVGGGEDFYDDTIGKTGIHIKMLPSADSSKIRLHIDLAPRP